jgi:hypothetical protein
MFARACKPCHRCANGALHRAQVSLRVTRDQISEELSPGMMQDVRGRLSHREVLARGEIFLSFPPSLSALVKNLLMRTGGRVVPCDWTCALVGDDDSVRTVRVLKKGLDS